MFLGDRDYMSNCASDRLRCNNLSCKDRRIGEVWIGNSPMDPRLEGCDMTAPSVDAGAGGLGYFSSRPSS